MSKDTRQGKKRRMTKYSIDELGIVPRGAQESPHGVIMKRRHADDDSKGKRRKIKKDDSRVFFMTSADEGHAHALSLWGGERGGTTWFSVNPEDGAPGDRESHDHPFVLADDGSLVVGENVGHSHTVDRADVMAAFMRLSVASLDKADVIAIAKACKIEISEDGGIADLLKAGASGEGKGDDMSEDAIKKMEARAVRAEAIAELNDAQSSYFKGLGTDDQASFLAKTADEQTTIVDEIIAKAKIDNAVVYTDLDGNEFTKSDDKRLIAAAKRADGAEKRVLAAEGIAKALDFRKVAEESYGSLPGTVETRTELAKAVAGIKDDDVRAEVQKTIQGGNAAMKVAMTTNGTRALGISKSGDVIDPNGGDAVVRLQKAADELFKDAGGDLTKGQAYEQASLNDPALADEAILEG